MNAVMARKWYRQACHDLDMAGKNVEIGGFDVAAFLSQQSVEKLLKAIYCLNGSRPPKSHFIDELGRGLGLQGEMLDDLLELTGDYTFSRYPDVSDQVPFEAYTKDVALEKVAARRVFDRLSEMTCPLNQAT